VSVKRVDDAAWSLNAGARFLRFYFSGARVKNRVRGQRGKRGRQSMEVPSKYVKQTGEWTTTRRVTTRAGTGSEHPER